MNVRELLTSTSPPAVLRLMVDGLPRAVWRFEELGQVDELERAAGAALAHVPAHSTARLEVAPADAAPASMAIVLQASAPAPAPATPADQLRSIMSTVEGFGRLGLQSIDKAQHHTAALLDRLGRENDRLRARCGELEQRIETMWETTGAGGAELLEAQTRAERERELLALGGTLLRLVMSRAIAGKGGGGLEAELAPLRHAFATLRPDQMQQILGALDDSQRVAVLDLFQRLQEAPAAPSSSSAPGEATVHPLRAVAAANRGAT